MANKVAVIVPNWNGQHHLEQCLSTLLGQTYPEFEIVVIDNGSTDGSVAMMRERFPQVRVITNAENVGFARANNQGILATDTPFVATLNNDTRSESTWLEEMIRAMEMSVEVGMVAAKVLYMDPPHLIDSAGIEVDRVGYAWNRHNGRPDSHQEREPYGVFGPSAAAALYRRHMLDDVGLFDESYFAYYEDTDLAWRAQLMGWRCLYAPAARVYHVHSATSRRQGSPFKRYFLVRNKTWTTFKNYPAPTVWLNLPVILLTFIGWWQSEM
jgi:GT2 family glycosyltransferase